MSNRQTRRALQLEARRRLKRAAQAGYIVPERFACHGCRGSGRRFRLWPWFWPRNRCRACGGSGLDYLTAELRTAYNIGQDMKRGLEARKGEP